MTQAPDVEPSQSIPPQPDGKDSAPTGRRFMILFLFMLGVLILYPYMQGTGFGSYTFRVLGAGIILLSLYAVSFRRAFILFAAVLAVPALVQWFISAEVGAGAVSIANTLLGFAFDVFVVVIIFRRAFTKEKPDSESIFGALCIYLLIGLSFTGIYGLLAALQTQAFYLDPLVNHHIIPDRFDLIYYSFATMTALGASGIQPVSSQARSLSSIEAISGTLYLAVFISRLVGTYRSHRNG